MLDRQQVVDNIEARRYSIWERLSDLFQIEPQLPGRGGKFRLSTIAVPVVSAIDQLWDNGLFRQQFVVPAGSTNRQFLEPAIPFGEWWMIYNASVVVVGGDNTVDDIRFRSIDDGGSVTDIVVAGGTAPKAIDLGINFPGGFRAPGGTAFNFKPGGQGVAATTFNVAIWHQKVPESRLIPAPPFA